MSDAPFLRVQSLETAYGASQVLFGIDLEVRAGEVVGLLGRNGMGKTTLIRSVIGWSPHGPAASRSTAARCAARARTGSRGWASRWCPKAGRCSRTVGRRAPDRVRRAPRRRGPRRTVGREARLRAVPRLAERRDNLGNQLSGGEQQMLAIGRALVTNPRLLILDEATEGLAPLIREEIWRCLRQLREAGQTILVVDKYVNRLIGIADRHVIVERGRIAWRGTSAELDADRAAWHRYLGV